MLIRLGSGKSTVIVLMYADNDIEYANSNVVLCVNCDERNRVLYEFSGIYVHNI